MRQSSFIMILSKSSTQSSTPLLIILLLLPLLLLPLLLYLYLTLTLTLPLLRHLHKQPPRLTTSYLTEHRVFTQKQPHVTSQSQMETNTNSFIHSLPITLACVFSHPLPSNHTSTLNVPANETFSLGSTSSRQSKRYFMRRTD